jgi:hypothetical protein
MVSSRSAILPAGERLTHEEACRLAALAAGSAAQTVVLDVRRCADASTSAYARLTRIIHGGAAVVDQSCIPAGIGTTGSRLFRWAQTAPLPP